MNFKQALSAAASGAGLSASEHAAIAEIAEGPSVNRAGAVQSLVQHETGSVGAVDWTNLVAAIKELLPIILQLIALFRKAP